MRFLVRCIGLILGGYALDALGGACVAMLVSKTGEPLLPVEIRYYASTQPKMAGADYKTMDEAGDFLREQLKADQEKLGADGEKRYQVIWSGNLTGYVSVAVGKNSYSRRRVSVGYARTQEEADKRALAVFEEDSGARVEKRFFTYGELAVPQ